MELIVEKGIPKRKDLKHYPYWSVKCTDRSDPTKSVVVTPTFVDVANLLTSILKHEAQVDAYIGRKSEYKKYVKFLKELYQEILVQPKLSFYDPDQMPPEIVGCMKDDNDAQT